MEYLLVPVNKENESLTVTIPAEIVSNISIKEQRLTDYLIEKGCTKTDTGNLSFHGRILGDFGNIVQYLTGVTDKKPRKIKQLLSKIKIPHKFLSPRIVQQLAL